MKHSAEFTGHVKDIFSSGCWERYENDIFTLSKYLLVNTTCFMGFIFFSGFGLYDILHAIQPVGTIAFTIGLLIGLNFVFLRVTKRLLLASYYNVCAVTVGFLYLLMSGGNGNTGPLWLFSLPVVGLFLLGLRGGTVFTLLFLAVSSMILYYPNFPLLTATYTPEFKSRFIASMVGVAGFSYVLEYIRVLIHKRLLFKNRQLEKIITKVQHAEAALSDEKERLSVTLRSIGDGVITTDIAGRILLINPVAGVLTGWAEQEAVGRPLSEVFQVLDEKTFAAVEDPVHQVLERQGVVIFSGRGILRDRHGKRKAVMTSGAPIRREENEIIGVVIVFRDVTGQREMEEELLKARKLESIGILAGGLAHDFNNLLTGILGNAQLAKLFLEDAKDPSQCLDGIEEAAQRAGALTQQLLTFSKGGAPVMKWTDISGLVRETADFSLSGSNVRARYAFPEALWHVEVDEGQISQVISNLTLNAQQAMAAGGEIEIRAENVTIAENELAGMRPGAYVKVSVKDQGEGIATQDLSRIFDPYFTTKEKGNGLGLATSYSIVDKHHGKITVESQVGKGTVFSLYLPAGGEQGRSLRQDGEPEVVWVRENGQGRGKVLIMDDEDFVLGVVQKMLSMAGYKTAAAKNGREAIEKYREAMQQGKPFDVVIMDLTIPGGMGGAETIRELLRIDRNARAVVSSGYSNDPVMAYYREHGFRACITKPLQMEQLLKTVQQVIAG